MIVNLAVPLEREIITSWVKRKQYATKTRKGKLPVGVRINLPYDVQASKLNLSIDISVLPPFKNVYKGDRPIRGTDFILKRNSLSKDDSKGPRIIYKAILGSKPKRMWIWVYLPQYVVQKKIKATIR